MLVSFRLSSEVHYLFHRLTINHLISEVDLVLDKLVGFQKCVLKESWSAESKVWLGHIDASNGDNITWSTLSGQIASCTDFHETGHMSNGHLIARLLNFDVLIALKSAGPNVHHQISFDVVRLALFTGALDQGVELFLVDSLVHFEAAGLARVYCHFHEWLHVGGACDDAAESDQRAYL